MALHWHNGHGNMYCCFLPLCDHIHRPCRTLELPKNLENENNWQGSTKSVQKIKWLQLHFNLTPVLGCREKLKPCQINDVYGNLCLNNYVSHVQRQVVGYSMQHGIIFRKHRSSHNLVTLIKWLNSRTEPMIHIPLFQHTTDCKCNLGFYPEQTGTWKHSP